MYGGQGPETVQADLQDNRGGPGGAKVAHTADTLTSHRGLYFPSPHT